MRFLLCAPALVAAGLTLAACSSMPEAPGYNDRQVTMTPVYCYKTLAAADCYDQPQPNAHRRLVNYDDPIRWQQETEQYRARYRTENAPQPSRGVAASNAPPSSLFSVFSSGSSGSSSASTSSSSSSSSSAAPTSSGASGAMQTQPARPPVTTAPIPTIGDGSQS